VVVHERVRVDFEEASLVEVTEVMLEEEPIVF
jgi:hypothetical protein